MIDVASFLIAGLVIGSLIGAVGVGGVVLAPLLSWLTSIDLHDAVATCMLAYCVSGLVGWIAYARRGSVDWQACRILLAGAVPGALAGAALAKLAPPDLLLGLIAAIAVLGGLGGLRAHKPSPTGATPRRPRTLLAVGVVTGLASAATGTSGPIVLLPMLFLLQTPPLAALGLAQAVQAPMAMAATLANAVAGPLYYTDAALLATALSTGILLGARAAHALPQAILRTTTLALLMLAAAALLLKLLLGGA